MHFSESQQKNVLMREEIYCTWIATALILSVLGSQFTGRDGIKDSMRATLDIITLGISSIIVVWASASFFEFIGPKMHKYVLVGIILSILALFIYVAAQTFRFKV